MAVSIYLSEVEAKKELTQQALLQVDKEWSEQTHIVENERARAELTRVSATNPEIEGSAANGDGGRLFSVTSDDYANTYINSNQARMIEEGKAGEAGLLTLYATENGEAPIENLYPADVAIGKANGFLDSTETIGTALINDFTNTVETAASIIGDSVTSCLDQGAGCVSSNPRDPYSGDRALIDLLQGDKENYLDHQAEAMADDVILVGAAAYAASGVVGDIASAISKKVEVKPVFSGNGSNIAESDFDGRNPVDSQQQEVIIGEQRIFLLDQLPEKDKVTGAKTEDIKVVDLNRYKNDKRGEEAEDSIKSIQVSEGNSKGAVMEYFRDLTMFLSEALK